MRQLEFISCNHEIDNVYTFSFNANGVQWQAGQYIAMVIPEVSSILEQYEHWFTISSAPFQKLIQITVRKSKSPFKQALFNLEPGDTIHAHTVDGDFTWPSELNPIFIAGGIGITPFISMLRQRQHEQAPLKAHLAYFNRNDSIIFKNELDKIAELHPEFCVHYFSEKPLSLNPILNLNINLNNTLTFLAGPVPMVDRLGQELAKLQLPYKQDYYFGYGITNF
jgi:ferredoxin-NADP reductase